MPRISALPPKTRAAGNDQIPINSTDDITTKRIDVNAITPTGSIMDFAGNTPPEGWLLCYGQTLNATANPQYALLWAVIGTLYGGTGIADFKLPDLRGRVVAGQDDMGGASANRLTGAFGGFDGDVMGASGGSESEVLTTAMIPAHNHGSGTLQVYANAGAAQNTATNLDDFAGSGGPIYGTHQQVGNLEGSTANTGGGAGHNNIQPTIILNKIIKW